MAKSITNVKTFLFILFIFGIFSSIIVNFGLNLAEKDLNGDIQLSNDSVGYISNLANINQTQYQATKDQLQDPVAYEGNASEGNPKDFAIEFLYSQKRSVGFIQKIKDVFTMPSTIFYSILRLPQNSFSWLINTIVWLLGLMTTIAGIYFVRGIVT